MRRLSSWIRASALAGLGLMPPPAALAQTASPSLSPDAGAASSTAADGSPAIRSACIEHIPEGKERPALVETFPERGRAGYSATLVVDVPHGLGETVLPGGFRLQLDSPEGRAITRAEFVIPALDGPASPKVKRSDSEGAVHTTVELPFVPLPKDPGPHTLTLPSVPIAIARQSGELITVCTSPHTLVVDDPTANVPSATPRPNPPPLRQLEVWTAAKNVALGALIALPLGALIALLVSLWLRRERPAPPPPPPRPPWELALEALARVRNQQLIERGLTSQLFDEVSLAVREYLGRRFGFDGLESTTRELLEHLARLGANAPEGELAEDIEALLRRADLVKFANLTPEAAECELALERGERIVRGTMVAPRPSPEVVAGAELAAAERGSA
jgi:hypothetical protein